MHAPVGMERRYESVIPATKHTNANIAEQITVVLNRLQICIAVSEGNTMRLEMSNAPIIRIPSTIVIAVSNAIIIL